MDKQSINEFLQARAGGTPLDDFAELVLRNYSFEERTALGADPAEQAYTVINRNIRAYENRRIAESEAIT